jgi:phage gp29-like protein
MAILDQFGNPIEIAQLQEPQTASLAQLRNEFDNHPSRGLTPASLARILQNAEQGDLMAQHELFQDMEEKDGHLFSVMDQRRRSACRPDWTIKPVDDATPKEKADAEWVEEVIESLEDFDDVLFDMTDAIGHGFSAQEMQWGLVEKVRMPIKIERRPQSWFKLALNPDISRNEIRLRDNSSDGAALWPCGWLLHQHRARSGYISRSGLYRVMAWPFLFKNYAVRDLAEFLEIYGLPLRLGTYNTTATKEDKATLLRAVVSIGHDAAAIIPQGMMIDFKEAAKGDNKSFDAMISLMERIQSKVALGGTLTSGEGVHGTQALGKVHENIALVLRDSDDKQLANTLKRQMVYPLLAFNRGLDDPRRCPSVVFDTQEPEDMALLSESVPKLVGMGMQIPVHWAHEKLKIPMATAGQAVLSIPTPQDIVPPAERPQATTPSKPVAPGQAGQANLKATVPSSAAPTEPDALDDLAAGMAGEWQEVMSETITPIQQALAQAASLEEFRDGLEEVLSQIEPVKLAALLAHGQFAARAWGQLNQVKK